MLKEQIRKVVYDQRMLPKGDYVPRKIDASYIDSPEVLVITGVRRCGKSVMLQQIREKQAERDYFLSFDDERLINFTVEDFDLLNQIFVEEFGVQRKYYFDEIQNVVGWERFVARLHKMGAKVFVTGSNANMLSRELGTFLTGRHIEFMLFPFSFKEYLDFKKIEVKRDMIFTTAGSALLSNEVKSYLKEGGFPQYLAGKNREFIGSFYNDIIYKDVLVRNKLTNEQQIREMMYFLASNVAHRYTFSSIARQIGVKSPDTVKAYIGFVEDTYLVYQLLGYSSSAGVQLRSPRKAYFIDNAVVDRIGFSNSPNSGSYLENLVCIELLRRKCDIFYFADKYECDFIVRRGANVVATFQVSVSLADGEVRKREIRGLIEAMKAFGLTEGTIITLEDNEELEAEDGLTIHVVPLWRWLMQI